MNCSAASLRRQLGVSCCSGETILSECAGKKGYVGGIEILGLGLTRAKDTPPIKLITAVRTQRRSLASGESSTVDVWFSSHSRTVSSDSCANVTLWRKRAFLNSGDQLYRDRGTICRTPNKEMIYLFTVGEGTSAELSVWVKYAEMVSRPAILGVANFPMEDVSTKKNALSRRVRV
jgi:hypothetical protein